ncbi:MAG: PilZ domain-containing protein [Thermodesulfovibrionales bacterium]
MQERRSHKRYTVDNLNIRGNILFISDIEIVNISLNGIAIRCDRRIDLNREYTLNLSYEGKELGIKGRVVWSMITGSRVNSRGEIAPIYTAGIEFIDVLSPKLSELVEFIESHRIEGEKRLSGVRFYIRSPEAARLDYPYNYRVKKISLSGMLIESTEPFEVGERFPIELYLNGKTFKCIGRVASCSKVPSEAPVHYDIGIAFMDVPKEYEEVLRNFISTLSD